MKEGKSKRVYIEEIADRCGVSSMTASRAFHGTFMGNATVIDDPGDNGKTTSKVLGLNEFFGRSRQLWDQYLRYRSPAGTGRWKAGRVVLETMRC
jgi:hypothetical protein